MMRTALHSDYAAMGLSHYNQGQNAFQAVPPRGVDKPCAAPKKTGPKPKAKARTMTAKGRELAEQFWNARILGDSLALDTLVSGLDRKDFIVELSRGKTFINVRDAAFAELYIEHSYENGFDSVGIVWQKQP